MLFVVLTKVAEGTKMFPLRRLMKVHCTRKYFRYEYYTGYAEMSPLPRLPNIHGNESITKIRRNVSVTKITEGMWICFRSEDLKPLEVISNQYKNIIIPMEYLRSAVAQLVKR